MPTTEKYSSKPPRWADRFLEWYCAPEHLEDVQGALYEYFYERVDAGDVKKARRYFVLDVIGHFRPHLIKKTKTQIHSFVMIQNNLKISLRSLKKHRLTTALNTLGLTVGIACFLIIMIWVQNEKSFDAFHEKADRIYRISNTFTSESEQFSQAPSGPALGAQLYELFPQIENSVRFYTTNGQMKVGDQTFFENGIGMVDDRFFDVFDFEVLRGNPDTFLDEPNSLVITESFARKYFGEADPMGQVVEIDQGDELKVTGVIKDVPPNSQMQFDLLISTAYAKANWNASLDTNWGGGWFHTYVLLSEGIDPKVLEAEVTEFIATKLTWFTERNMSYNYFLQPIKSIHLESDLRYDFGNNGSSANVTVFSLVAIVVLVLACINYINLTTANAINRSKETGVRKVIGALRRQLISQFLAESVLVSVISALLACGLIYVTFPAFETFIGYEIPFELSLSAGFWLLAGAIALGLLAGLIPAVIISSFKSLDVLKGKLRRGTKGNRIRKVLVVFQFTMTVALLIAIITVTRQMQFIQEQDLGMSQEEVVLVNFRGLEAVNKKRQVLTDRLLQNPAVEAVSFQRNSYPVGGLSNSTITVETGDGNRVSSSLYRMTVDPQFYETFGLEMAAGRFFSTEIATDSTQAIVVNEAAVASFGWGTAESALGREMGDAPNVRKVIGVVKDFNFESLQKKVAPLRMTTVRGGVYGTLALRANLSEPLQLVDFLEEVWSQVVPEVPLEYTFMNEDIQEQYQAEMSFRSVFLFFSILSVFIACLGLFGLATASAHERVKEMGIRKVLGASQKTLISIMSKDFLLLVVIALILASPLAWYAMDQWLQGFAYRISFSWTFIVMAGLMALALSLVTVSYQALKAASRNPVNSLRYE